MGGRTGVWAFRAACVGSGVTRGLTRGAAAATRSDQRARLGHDAHQGCDRLELKKARRLARPSVTLRRPRPVVVRWSTPADTCAQATLLVFGETGDPVRPRSPPPRERPAPGPAAGRFMFSVPGSINRCTASDGGHCSSSSPRNRAPTGHASQRGSTLISQPSTPVYGPRSTQVQPLTLVPLRSSSGAGSGTPTARAHADAAQRGR